MLDFLSLDGMHGYVSRHHGERAAFVVTHIVLTAIIVGSLIVIIGGFVTAGAWALNMGRPLVNGVIVRSRDVVIVVGAAGLFSAVVAMFAKKINRLQALVKIIDDYIPNLDDQIAHISQNAPHASAVTERFDAVEKRISSLESHTDISGIREELARRLYAKTTASEPTKGTLGDLMQLRKPPTP